MEYDPPKPTYLTSDPTSFAHKSARHRWPAILTGAIDDLHRTISSLSTSSPTDSSTTTDPKITDGSKVAEGKSITSALATLKYELQHNRILTPLPDDGFDDIELYNEELEARGNPKWHDVQWLYAECYLYRRIAGVFGRSTEGWKGYDVFGRQKLSTFRASRTAVVELAGRYREIVLKVRRDGDVVGKKAGEGGSGGDGDEESREAEKVLFEEMAQVCLWGNATDLSLLTSLTYEDIQKLQGSKARMESQRNILVNDLERAFDVLEQAKREGRRERRVDIVLDNAGFELFVDLVLAGYLIATGLATEVVMHPKSIPWFVSDVVPKDLADLLEVMRDPKSFYEEGDEDGREAVPLSEKDSENIKFLFDDWSRLHSEGQLILRPNRFWTHAGSYWRMPHVAPELFEDLKESEMVIFKGDLNYRKLTGDAAWDPTTPFTTAIGPLGKQSGIRVLALRTCKADVVVGLPPAKDEEIRDTPGGGGDSGGREWAWSGKWAVVQFCDGKT